MVTMPAFEFFYGREHPFSQWYVGEFILDDIRFNSAEQWMMYAKAMLFNDQQKAAQILAATDPSVQRRLGRQVRYFNEASWTAQCRAVVYRGNQAKFTQDPQLAQRLIDTNDAVLAEASPTDLRWGIGLAIDNPDRFDMTKWRGLNWLGLALMDLRSELLAQ